METDICICSMNGGFLVRHLEAKQIAAACRVLKQGATMDQEVQEFISGLEIEHGGTIIFKTYAILIGTELYRQNRNQTGGLLYIVDRKLIFEDFEKQASVFGLALTRKKQKYEKFRISLDIEEIESAFSVKASQARTAAGGRNAVDSLKPAAGWTRKLMQTAVLLRTRSGGYWLLEVLNDRDFLVFLEQKRKEVR